MSSAVRRLSVLSLASTVVASSLAVVVPALTQVADAAPRTKVKYEVCHRTNAIKNPYRRISVAWSAVDDNNNGHDNPVHDGPVFDVTNPQATHGTTPRDSGLGAEAGGGNDRWGDIFYAVRQVGNQWNANNWFVDDSNRNSGANVAGQAIFDGTAINSLTGKPACRAMSVVEFIASEREANPNISMEDIMDELDDMEAAEDLPLKTVLGGSFGGWYATCQVNCDDVSVISQAIEEKLPKVTTEPPTNFTGGTTATLNGTVAPLGTAMQWYFEWVPTTPNFADNNNAINVTPLVAANSSTPSTPAQNVTANLTGLTAGTTYYYRTVGLVTSGSNDTEVESYTYGVVKQFNANAPGSPTITGVVCGDTTLAVTVSAPTVNAGSISGYEYSTDGGVTYASLANGAGTTTLTGLTNGQRYDIVVRAVAGSVKGLDSTVSTGIPCGTPLAVTDPATPVTQASTTIRGNLSGKGNALTVTFIWGIDSTLTSGTTTSNATPNTLPGTADEYPVTFNVTNLTVGTTYYYRVVGTYGNNATVQGNIEQFTIVAPPAVTTEPATSVTGTTATINGTGTSNGASSTVTFIWGTDPTLTTGNTTVTAAQSPLASNANGTAVTAALTGLTPGTTYYFRTIINNANTNTPIQGSIRQFTTETPSVVASPTTTVAASSALGRVIGVAWFDINRNDRREADEPLLPGIEVELVPRTVSGQSLGRVTKSSYTASTDTAGAFDFSQLPPGTYQIKSILPDGYGIEKSWDSTGNSDWMVTVTVVANKTARGDFAAIGEALGTGTVTGGGGGTVDATWNGFDGSGGTDDDVTFTAKIATDGGFTLAGMPTGRFTVSATSSTGRRLVSAQSLRVGPSGATLNIAGMTLNVRIVAILPATGATGLAWPLGVSLMMLPAGLATTALVRRRRRV